MGVPSDGSYGTPEGVIFSYPVTTSDGNWKIVEGFEHDEWAKARIRTTGDELVSEREAVADLLE